MVYHRITTTGVVYVLSTLAVCFFRLLLPVRVSFIREVAMSFGPSGSFPLFFGSLWAAECAECVPGIYNTELHSFRFLVHAGPWAVMIISEHIQV